MRKVFLSIAAGAAAMSAVTGANAASVLQITSISTLAGSPSGTVKNDSNSYSAHLAPQQVTGELDGVDTSFLAYCIELTERSGTGLFDVVSLKDYLGGFYGSSAQTRTDLISNLLGTHGGSGNLSTEVALQLAIWELRYETLGDIFDLKHDDFKVTSYGLDSYINTANSLFNSSEALTHGTYEFFVATSDGYYQRSGKHKKWVEGKQDLLFYTYTPSTPPVPEPATWAMMVGGLGLVGMQMRRRKTAVSFV
jgi:hypothetical protein